MNTSNNSTGETAAPKSDKLLLPALVGLFIVILVALQWGQSSRAPGISEGSQAPEFQVKDISGNTVKLSDYRGKVLFLNFWATFCSSCLSEMPSMNSLYQELADDDFAMLAINVDNDEKQARAMALENRWMFVVAQDNGGAIAGLYRTTGIPETFIIDRNGKVVDYVIGPQDWDKPDVVKALKGLLEINREGAL